MDSRFVGVASAFGLLAAFSWLSVSASPLLVFAAAVVIGAGWCRWLDTHPDPRR